MDEREPSATAEPAHQSDPASDPPPGDHALEVGARRGIGPLSPLARTRWHGDARPCVSCGQLVLRDAAACDHCGQKLDPAMVEKMRTHAGPWYVLEHVRPFPGVSLERIIRQVRRGLITETSIVRGPSTDHQWRFAVEAPGLCRYFGKCWSCHETVSPSDTYCQHCLSYLSFEKPRTAPLVAPSAKTSAPSAPAGDRGHKPAERTLPGDRSSSSETESDRLTPGREPPQTPARPIPPSARAEHLKQLSAVVEHTDLPAHQAVWDEPPRIAGIRATWVAVVLLMIVIAALMFFTRPQGSDAPPRRSAVPGVVLPGHTAPERW